MLKFRTLQILERESCGEYAIYYLTGQGHLELLQSDTKISIEVPGNSHTRRDFTSLVPVQVRALAS